MFAISLVALFVDLFGAYAYGSATVLSMTRETSVWGANTPYPANVRRSIDRVSLALFALSTAWFVLHAAIEFNGLAGLGLPNALGLATFIVFFFPPVIMHVVLLESLSGEEAPRGYLRALASMYVLSPGLGLLALAAVFDLVPAPPSLGAWIGTTIGGLFTVASAYATAVMMRRPRTARTADQRKLRTVMISLFALLSVTFLALVFLREGRLLVAVLDRIVRASPIYFLIASVYFENRFHFYDLVVKRGLLMLGSMVGLAGCFAVALPLFDRLPADGSRPWLFAATLAPVAMVMPWLYARAERWLDRMWFGRELTPVEAVKHVLAAMQPATDEATLVSATERRLSEIFGARFLVLTDGRPAPSGTVIADDVSAPAPSGGNVRIVAVRAAGTRRLLSEDLALLRSIASVFGFMVENIRLHRRRQEQDQVAQDLRLQSSRSELKALRAQINPHFLFNALNAIASLIHTDPARADIVVEQLAEIFRYTLRRSDSEWAPLDQELAFAQAYLDVEQARFGTRLACAIDSDHRPPAPQVPSMLLQTLIENAVKHGVSQAREAGRVEVVVRTTSAEVVIEVRDTGPGIGAGTAAREGEGFGLRSIRERLRGHFGERASFTLTRDEAAGTTVARVTMPHVRIAA